MLSLLLISLRWASVVAVYTSVWVCMCVCTCALGNAQISSLAYQNRFMELWRAIKWHKCLHLAMMRLPGKIINARKFVNSERRIIRADVAWFRNSGCLRDSFGLLAKLIIHEFKPRKWNIRKNWNGWSLDVMEKILV